jgi:hypothetical protein
MTPLYIKTKRAIQNSNRIIREARIQNNSSKKKLIQIEWYAQSTKTKGLIREYEEEVVNSMQVNG